jgi:hypothetical protein
MPINNSILYKVPAMLLVKLEDCKVNVIPSLVSHRVLTKPDLLSLRVVTPPLLLTTSAIISACACPDLSSDEALLTLATEELETAALDELNELLIEDEEETLAELETIELDDVATLELVGVNELLDILEAARCTGAGENSLLRRYAPPMMKPIASNAMNIVI